MDIAVGHEEMESLIGSYGWLVVVAAFLFLMRKIIEGVVTGYIWKRTAVLDNIYFIRGRRARLIRVGLTATTFYMTDRMTSMLVPNEQLKCITFERMLSDDRLCEEVVPPSVHRSNNQSSEKDD